MSGDTEKNTNPMMSWLDLDKNGRRLLQGPYRIRTVFLIAPATGSEDGPDGAGSFWSCRPAAAPHPHERAAATPPRDPGPSPVQPKLLDLVQARERLVGKTGIIGEEGLFPSG
jgi:hypothetical protein